MEFTINIPIPSSDGLWIFFVAYLWAWIFTLVYFWLWKPITDDYHGLYGNLHKSDSHWNIPLTFFTWWLALILQYYARRRG